MRSKQRALRALLTAAAAFLTTAAPGAASTAGTAAVFNDSTGEVAGGPDIGQILVSTDNAGVIRSTASIAGLPAIGSEGGVLFLFDTDRNAATGELRGADYAILFYLPDGSSSLFRWTGSEYDFADRVKAPFVVSGGGGSVRFELNRSNLGSPDEIGFGVMAVRGPAASGDVDFAPDAGLYPYRLAAPAVEGLRAQFTAARPKAGKAFGVMRGVLGLGDGSSVSAQALRCRASLAGKALPAAAGCRWRIPAGARGKRLVVRVEAKYDGRWLSFKPWNFKVA